MDKINENEIFLLLQRAEHICRLCFSSLEEGLKCYSIFEPAIHETLQYCLWNQIKFNDDDDLPQLICSKCYTSLENTCTFLDIIIKSQDVVDKFLRQKEILKFRNDSFSENDNDEASIVTFHGDPEDNKKEVVKSLPMGCIKTEKKTRNKTLDKSSQETSVGRILKLKKNVNKDLEKTTKTKKCCSQKFRTKTEYYAHVRSHGVVRKNYGCSDCDKKYVSHFELQVHLRKHSGEKPFSCSVCEKSFIDKRNLKKHEKIHSGNKTHECQVCQRKFLHLFTLKTHERIHSGEKPYVCESCGKSFNTSTELKIHSRTHSKEKPYKCKNCDKAFSSKAALNTHMLVHTGEKKYGCTVCNRKCRTSYDLKTHMRCHSNERPYSCTYTNCDKKYKNSSQLNVHLRTHKGEKHHQCMICFKQFGESNTLKRHMGIHEKNIERIF